VLHPYVCAFHKYSFGDRTTGEWRTEPWTVAQFPMGRKELAYHERRVAELGNWEAIQADILANPGPPGPDFDAWGALKLLPDGGTVLQVPPRKPTLMLRWEKVTPVLDWLAASQGFLSPDGVVRKDGDAATLTIPELREYAQRFC
jgi:hypothetical protein